MPNLLEVLVLGDKGLEFRGFKGLVLRDEGLEFRGGVRLCV